MNKYKLGYFSKHRAKYCQLGPLGLVVRFIHWTPKGHCKVTNNILLKITTSTRQLLDPKIEKSPTSCKFEKFYPHPQLDIKI